MKIRTFLHLALLAALAAMVSLAVVISWLFASVRDTSTERVIVIGAVALSLLLIAVFVATWHAHNILTKPLQRLLAAMEEVGRGNLEHRIGIAGKNEIGVLSQAIDQMAGRLRKITASRDELARAEKQLKLSARALDSAAEGMMIVQHGKIVAVNRAFRIITGYTAKEVMGQSVQMLHAGVDMKRQTERRNALARTGIWHGEILGRRKDGEVYPAWVSLSVVKEEDGRCYVSMFSDISSEKNEEVRLNYLAYHDALTDLPNRIMMLQRMNDILARAQRRGSTVALLYIDLDHFKPINDMYGHDIGDVILQEAARRLRDCVRKTDTVARLGGDEYGVVLDELGDVEEAALIAQNLLDALRRPFPLEGIDVTSRPSENTLPIHPPTVSVSASLGISCFPHDGESAKILLRKADAAMYEAKQDKQIRYRYYSNRMELQARERAFLSAALCSAMEKNELALVYQPSVLAKNGQLQGVEALMRWCSPEHGTVLPNRFIGLAEETGMIEPMLDWVLNKACMQLRYWKVMGMAPKFVSVNLSAHQFYQEDLADRIEAIISRADIEPRCLELEISESIVMRHPEIAARTLARLSAIGVRLALDDFGISNLPLANLQAFPVSRLKIDQSLVSRLPGDFEYANLVRAIICIADSLKLSITAKGVETEEQCHFLMNAGCEAMQGYLFCKPLAPDELEEFASRTDLAYR